MLDYHPVLGHDTENAKAWWSVVAPRYADETHVFYDLTNEPGTPSENLATNHFRVLVNGDGGDFKGIRTYAPNTMLVLWSSPEAKTGHVNGIIDHSGKIEGNGMWRLLNGKRAFAGCSYKGLYIKMRSLDSN